MPDEQVAEMGKWTSPDGIELEVPAEHLKSLQGVNERFGNLTKREQELATKEKDLESGYEQRVREDRERWLEGMTPEEWEEYKKLIAPDEKEAKPDPKSEGGDTDVLKKLNELEGWKNQREQQEAEQKRALEQREAELDLDKTFRELADGSDAYKSLSCDKSREMAIGRAWDIMQSADYQASEKQVIEDAIKEQLEYEKDIIDSHAKGKEAGPGAPGASAGDVERPPDLSNPDVLNKYLVDVMKSHRDES